MKYLFVSITILVSVLIVGCGPSATPIKGKIDYQNIPKRVPTNEENAQIQATLNLISDLTTKFGPRLRFDRIPIFITSENWKKTKRVGVCSDVGKLNENSNKYIVLNSLNFKYDKEFKESELFWVLLHEIGHCYFGREHEKAILYKEGHAFRLTNTEEDELTRKSYSYEFEYICKSAMCTNPRGDFRYFSWARGLKEYYVGEILGKVRADDIADFQKFIQIEYIPLSEARIGTFTRYISKISDIEKKN